MKLIYSIRERFANWLLNDVHLRKPIHFGKNSISVTPLDTGFSPLDVIRWSASSLPEDVGDMGMDLDSGRPRIITIGGEVTELGLLRSIYYVTQAGAITIPATTGFTNIFSIPISTGNNTTLILRASLSGNILGVAAPEHLDFRFQLDGVTVGAGSAITAYPDTPANAGVSASLFVFEPTIVGAGAHTVTFQWSASTVTAGTGSIDSTIPANHCTVTIEEYTIPNNGA